MTPETLHAGGPIAAGDAVLLGPDGKVEAAPEPMTVEQLARAAALAGDENALATLLQAAYMAGARAYAAEAARRRDRQQAKKRQRQTAKKARKQNRG